MNVEFKVFGRLCSRCREIILEVGAPAVLVNIYQTATGPALDGFTAAMRAVKLARTRHRKAVKGMKERLEEMDGLFQSARAAVAAIDPETELPLTLKSQRTDTDKRDALKDLVDELVDRTGETWADDLRQGEFGQKAAETIQALDEAIAAANALQRAQGARVEALEAAWPVFVSFRRLVKTTLGASSKQHQRLRVRKGGSLEVEEGEEGEGGEGEEGEDGDGGDGGEGGEGEAPPSAPGAPPAPDAAPSIH